MAVYRRTLSEEEEERLRRLAAMRMGIEQENDAQKTMQEAAGKAAEEEPVSEEWTELEKLDQAVEDGAFGQEGEDSRETVPPPKPEAVMTQEKTAADPDDMKEEGEEAEQNTTEEDMLPKTPQEEPPDKTEEEADQTTDETEQDKTEKPEAEQQKGYAYNGKVYGDGELDLSHDPVAAIAVMHIGGMNAVTEGTIKAANEWAEQSDGFKAVFGILTDENMQEYAEIGENGELSEKNNLNAHSIFISNCTVLGATLSKFAMKLNNPDFPPELYGDAVGTLLAIIEKAEAGGESGNGEVYDAYIKNNMDSEEVAALVSAFGFCDGLFTEKNGLDVVMKAAVEDAQLRCREGKGTQEDYALLEAQVPKLTTKERNKDETYSAYSDRLMNEREDGNRYDTENNWYTEQTKRYMQLNGIGTDMYSPEATVAKDALHAFRKEALDQVTDYAVMLGYENLGEFMTEKGFDMETIDELALHNFRQYEKEVVTDRCISALVEMIGQGEEGGEAQGEDASISEIFVRGIAAGASGYLSDGLESFYTWVQSTNIPTDSAKLRNQYTAKYGFFGGEKELYNELMGMCETGFFPNESMAKSVKSFLEDGGNPYLLGIDPSELGWAAERANSMEDFKEVHDEWMAGLNEEGKKLYKAGSWVGENVPGMLLESVFISPALKATGASGACADILTPLLSTGGRWYNDGYTKGADKGYGYVDRNIVAVTNMLGSWIGNCETKSSSMMKAGYSAAITQLSMPEITRFCSSVAVLGQKIPKEIKEAIVKSAGGLVESRFDEEKAKVGALLASEGTEMFLGNPEAEDGLQPSDELMRIVRWMQMYQ